MRNWSRASGPESNRSLGPGDVRVEEDRGQCGAERDRDDEVKGVELGKDPFPGGPQDDDEGDVGSGADQKDAGEIGPG